MAALLCPAPPRPRAPPARPKRTTTRLRSLATNTVDLCEVYLQCHLGHCTRFGGFETAGDSVHRFTPIFIAPINRQVSADKGCGRHVASTAPRTFEFPAGFRAAIVGRRGNALTFVTHFALAQSAGRKISNSCA